MGIGDESSVVGVEMWNLVPSFSPLGGGARGSLGRTGYSIFLRNNFFFSGPHLLTGSHWPFQMTPPNGGRDVDWMCGKRRHALG
jgi:hypothetical protein